MTKEDAEELVAQRFLASGRPGFDDPAFARYYARHSFEGQSAVAHELFREVGRQIRAALPRRLRELLS